MASAPYLMQAGASAYGVSVPAATQLTQGFAHSAGTLPFPPASTAPGVVPTFPTWVGGIQAPFTTGPQGSVGGGGGGGGGWTAEVDTPSIVGQSAASTPGALTILGTAPAAGGVGLTAGIPNGGNAPAAANLTFSSTAGATLQHRFGAVTVTSAGTLALNALPTNAVAPVQSDVVVTGNRVLLSGNYTTAGQAQTKGTMGLNSAPSAVQTGGAGSLTFATAGAANVTCDQYMVVSFGATDGTANNFLIPLIPVAWAPAAAPVPVPSASASASAAGARMAY